MDNVNHPIHYNQGKIEVIEFIEDQGLNFSRGNAVKYIARAGKKGGSIEKEIEDLEKATWYCRREVERLIAEKENREPRPNEMTHERALEKEDWQNTSLDKLPAL